MAVTYVWPVSLPQAPRREYGEDFGVLTLRTPMDKGPAKMRRIGARPDTMSLSFFMTTAQVAALRTFVASTLKGTARFGFPHPRTGVQVEARFVPQSDNKYFDTSFVSAGRWDVSMVLEILP
jgi:hypothetical protein